MFANMINDCGLGLRPRRSPQQPKPWRVSSPANPVDCGARQVVTSRFLAYQRAAGGSSAIVGGVRPRLARAEE